MTPSRTWPWWRYRTLSGEKRLLRWSRPSRAHRSSFIIYIYTHGNAIFETVAVLSPYSTRTFKSPERSRAPVDTSRGHASGRNANSRFSFVLYTCVWREPLCIVFFVSSLLMAENDAFDSIRLDWIRSTRSRKKVSEEDIIAHARGALAGYKCPKEVVFRGLPKTATGEMKLGFFRKLLQILSLDWITQERTSFEFKKKEKIYIFQ